MSIRYDERIDIHNRVESFEINFKNDECFDIHDHVESYNEINDFELRIKSTRCVVAQSDVWSIDAILKR